MILKQNDFFLQKAFPQVSKYLQDNMSGILLEPLEMEETRNGKLNLTLKIEGRDVPFHSKYDPLYEAEQLIKKYEEELCNGTHVVFYGCGLGYQITEVMKKFPHLTYSLYEPYPAVFYHCLKNKDYRDIYLQKAKNIYLGNHMDHYLKHFASQNMGSIVIVPHPVYERIFSDKYKAFLERFTVQLQEQRLAIGVNVSFQRLWILNGMANFAKVLKTPNIMKQKLEFFCNRPIVIVSAGPSLEEEYDQLREIKLKGLAYIIAVGSANRALIGQEIYPDAVCSYDPSILNHIVFDEIIQQKINSIPLIFGSTVGFQTTDLYPGPMLHMITSQDHVGKYLLGEDQLMGSDGEMIIQDAPSIAIIALVLFCRLNCSRIILVGQNFAFKNNRYYSKGIAYSDRSNELQLDEITQLLEVESVDGQMVFTNAGHNSGRSVMETYISMFKGIDFINTTNGGARIKGARYLPLQEVIDTFLLEPVVNTEWYLDSQTDGYDFKPILSRKAIFKEDHDRLEKQIMNASQMVKKIETAMLLRHGSKVEKIVTKFNELNQRLYDNKYYQLALQPMVRFNYALLQKELGNIQREKDVFVKAAMIVEHFGSYIYACQLAFRDTEIIYRLFIESLEKEEETYLQTNKGA